jgi:hypothetical protein
VEAAAVKKNELVVIDCSVVDTSLVVKVNELEESILAT